MDYAANLLSKLPGASKRDHGLRHLLDTLASYLPDTKIKQIADAYTFGAAAHKGQTRKTGEPYITHPVAVAQELADMRLDSEAIMAAILHDTVEDTDATLEEITEQFGGEVALLVDGVSKLDQIQFHSRAEASREFPQDDARDDRGHSCDPCETRRSPAQHANTGRDARRKEATYRP